MQRRENKRSGKSVYGVIHWQVMDMPTTRTILMTSTPGPRLKILERAPEDHRPPLRLTGRDFDIIHAVYKHRVLSTSQIEALLFRPSPGRPYSRKKRCQTRLKLLFHHSWLFRNLPYAKPYAPKQDLLYTLDRRGIERLAVELDLKPRQVAKRSSPRLASASYLFLKHTLMVNELQILLDLSAQGFAPTPNPDIPQPDRNEHEHNPCKRNGKCNGLNLLLLSVPPSHIASSLIPS